MKKWNAAAIEELNIAETANGFFPFCKEFCIITNDSLSNTTEEGETDKGDNVTTDTVS